jgi:hypothetical protein
MLAPPLPMIDPATISERTETPAEIIALAAEADSAIL